MYNAVHAAGNPLEAEVAAQPQLLVLHLRQEAVHRQPQKSST